MKCFQSQLTGQFEECVRDYLFQGEAGSVCDLHVKSGNTGIQLKADLCHVDIPQIEKTLFYPMQTLDMCDTIWVMKYTSCERMKYYGKREKG